MFVPIHHLVVLLIFVLTIRASFADTIIPTEPGMSWNYNMTQEVGAGVKFSDLKPDADGKYRAAVMYRLDGTEKVDGKDFLKFEMYRAGVVTNTDLMTVDDRGVRCSARVGLNGEMVRLDPPQIIVATPLRTGVTWDFDGKVDGSDVHQHYRIIAQEVVRVPAGEFHAFHIHGDQTSPAPMTIDRWFVNETGIIKDVTETRNKTDELIRRISLELSELPKAVARPQIKSKEPSKKLTCTLGKDPIGEAAVKFTTDTPKIHARWQGHDLTPQSKIRAVWIAENIGDDVPQDYTIDEATATATAPDAHGVFTLSRPDRGWTPGDYRVEFYVDDALANTVKLTIAK